MLRISLSGAVLASLMGAYWVNPGSAWAALCAVATLALARYIRQRDYEAERALLPIDD